nr:hypothetical protein [Tessaracoccus coleopterorum]
MITDTGLEPSHLSGHLAVLRRHGLVRSERRGSQVFYRLAYPEITELLRVARTLLGRCCGTPVSSSTRAPASGRSGARTGELRRRTDQGSAAHPS